MDKKLFTVKLFIAFIVLSSFTKFSFGQITFTPKTDITITSSAGAMFMIAADINNDGLQDLITANQNLNGISVFLNTTTINSTTPTFSAQTNFATGTAPHSVAAGDINGDGLLDLVAANTTSSTISVFLNTTTPGASTPTMSTKTDFTPGTNPYSVVLKDMNGDGKLDIVCANQVSNTVGIFINTTTPGAATPTFSSMFSFGTPGGPTHLAVADLNGDGLPDIVVPNNTAANVSVFFNTTTVGSSTPTLGTRADYTAGTTVWSVALGDFNLDGKIDIVCANRGAASASYFLNTTATGSSTPSFTAKTDLTVGSTPFGVGVGDLNCDGKPDILDAARGSANFSVFLNNTTPNASSLTLLTRADYTTASQPYFPIIADFNGDGKPDVAVNTGTGNAISVFINTTDLSNLAPSFSARTDYTATNYPISIATADLNGDGKLDLLSTNYNSTSVSVFMNTVTPGASSPSFGARTDFTGFFLPYSVKPADFNSDGKVDIVVIEYTGNQASVLLNTTPAGSLTPTFSAKTSFAGNSSPLSASIADFNGDGMPDFCFVNYAGGTVSVYLNTTTPGASTPSFTSPTLLGAGTNPFSSTTADYNGDGKPDIAVSNTNSGTVYVYLNTTTPGSSTPTFSNTSFAALSNPRYISSADFNGDGKPDLAVGNTSTNVISVFFNSTAPGASAPVFTKTDISVTGNSSSIGVGDLNGDGKPDIAAVCQSLDLFSVLLNTTSPGSSTPAFSAPTDFATVDNPNFAIIKDVNNDGKPDMITGDAAAPNAISVFLNTTVYALPVELASFTSNVNGNNVVLSWNTVSEENNSGFEIERNSFGAGWTKIGFVKGKGTTNSPQSYSFTDNALSSGRYSYRLKQIDYNGNYKYYDLQNEVVIGVPDKFALMQNYPNPFNPATVISYQLPVDGFVSLKIFDMSGREVSQLVNEVRTAGYYNVYFDAKNLSSGTYFYKISTDKYSDVKKMVVVK